jgi:predicted DCC family thiol-disulfide oxidoreductase YuxK
VAERDPELTVFYDGACPRCVGERARYERMSGDTGERVCWLDITGRDEVLAALGIDPGKALRELHVRDADGRVHRELDAYILLMRRVPVMRPLAWLIGLPVIRPLLARLYRAWVLRRLRRTGRL